MTSSGHQFTPSIILVDIPPSILCGIDLLSFTTSPKFQGIKDLPQGFHFIFTSETSSLSIRDGFWFYIPEASSYSEATLIVRKWDSQKSCLAPVADPKSYRLRLDDVWEAGLSPYRQSAQKEAAVDGGDWYGLTQHIKPGILRHLTQNDQLSLNSASCASVDQDDIPGLSSEETGYQEREIGVLGIDLKRTWPEGAIGRERTDAATDRSWALEELVKQWQDEEAAWGCTILGQMEACFVMVLTLANYSCLEEWKRCLSLVLTCKKAVREHEHFFVEFLSLLKRQMARCEDVEGGLFDMTDQDGSLLKAKLKGFKQALRQMFSGSQGDDIKEEMEELEKTLNEVYGWNLSEDLLKRGVLELEDGETVDMEVDGLDGDEEDGEYAPVVVDLEDT